MDLKKTILFQGLDDGETDQALKGLQAETRKYQKGTMIFHSGMTTERLGLILSGSVTIESNDIWGNRTILSLVPSNQYFAETYAFLPDEPLLVDVVANEDCEIAFFTLTVLQENIVSSWGAKMLANLLTISLRKNLMLSGRSFHTAPKTIRERVMAYLNSLAIQKGSSEFDIPFDRQQLADYLNVERTALSKELGRMQKDGRISVRKNHFCIIHQG